MKNIIKISLIASMLVSASFAKDVDSLDAMFKDGKASGEIKSMYYGVDYKNAQGSYATAIGGLLNYKLANYNGFSGGIEFATTYDIAALSGLDARKNDSLSSTEKNYTQLTQAYISYDYDFLNITLGKQKLDTPLADSDDYAMIANSFNAYTFKADFTDLKVLGGSIVSWQGVDASLDEGWVKISQDPTYFLGASYSNDLVDTNIWFYNINGVKNDKTANNSFYTDLALHHKIDSNIEIGFALQYLNQTELDESGIASNIYGASLSTTTYGVNLSMAYNKSLKKSDKESFAGFGGGTLFTSMTNMTLNAISADRDADALIGSLSYELDNFNFSYAYGDFNGDASSRGVVEHIVEQTACVEYAIKNLTLGLVFTNENNKKGTTTNGGSWNDLRTSISYSF